MVKDSNPKLFSIPFFSPVLGMYLSGILTEFNKFPSKSYSLIKAGIFLFVTPSLLINKLL